MIIDRLDHLVLTVDDIEQTVDFYCGVLGMERIAYDRDRTALRFGSCKVNLHQRGREFSPHAATPTPGSADICLITRDPVETTIAALAARAVPIEVGPVDRNGATGPIRSVYVRDPDGNLIEIGCYPGG